MNIIFDAGSLINLSNGEMLAVLCGPNVCNAFVGAIVEGECTSIATAVSDLCTRSILTRLPDLALTPFQFAQTMTSLNLGAGETECIINATNLGYAVSCDDIAARRQIERHLGPDSLVGTAGLLKRAVGLQVISSNDAISSYAQMKKMGGYLPNLPDSFFG